MGPGQDVSPGQAVGPRPLAGPASQERQAKPSLPPSLWDFLSFHEAQEAEALELSGSGAWV